MVMDVNQTYYGDHFSMCADNKSLRCTPKTKTMLCVDYIFLKKKQTPNQSMVRGTRGCTGLGVGEN